MDAVFTTPELFREEPLISAFYHPTNAREIPFNEQKTCLSKKFSEKTTGPEGRDMLQPEHFLSGSNNFYRDLIPNKENECAPNDHSGSSKFDESWPNTERTNSTLVETPPSVTSLGISRQIVGNRRVTSDTDIAAESRSTIAKYIQRFRNEPPKSREERLQNVVEVSKGNEFWWAEQVNDSSTPKDSDVSSFSPPVRLREAAEKGRPKPLWKRGGKPPLSPEQRKTSSLQNQKGKDKNTRGLSTRKMTDSDPETDLMQQRAQRLIEMSESTLSTSSSGVPVSQDSMKEQIYEPQKLFPVPHANTRNDVLLPRQKPAPEDDILYQWRLARKIEKARQRTDPFSKLPHLKSGGSKLAPDTDKEQIEKEEHGKPKVLIGGETKLPAHRNVSDDAAKTVEDFPPVAPEGRIPALDKDSKSKNCQTVIAYKLSSTGQHAFAEYSDVAAHMHMACDILPCPHTQASSGDQGTSVISCCPQQRAILRKGTLGNPLLIAPPIHIDNDGLSQPDRGVFEVAEASTNCSPAMSEVVTRKDDIMAKKLEDRLTSDKDGFLSSSDNKVMDKIEGDFNGCSETSSVKSAPEPILDKTLQGDLKKKNGDHTTSSKDSLPNAEREKVRETINQVISENIFLSSMSSVASSASEKELGLEVHQGDALFEEDLQATYAVIATDSSDDEFPDDEILKVLRMRRHQYKQALSNINTVLTRPSAIIDKSIS
ncbi:uncharacterized protein LOC135684579 isoform X1 [Rhopilema esculentum]|uniref:uncharacterized protein LOC135684579 isoform X1 n=1 Tax=Rhopilema esculentum TaxID=499914 RepID=UPI0031CFCBA6